MYCNTMQNIVWEVVYEDGETLPQYNEDGTANKYTDIDRVRLKEFRLLSDGIKKLVIHLNGNKRLIYRKRVTMDIAGPTQGQQRIVYLAGWQEKIDNRNIQMISFLFDDGHIEILDRFDENYVWSSSIVLLKEEVV